MIYRRQIKKLKIYLKKTSIINALANKSEKN